MMTDVGGLTGANFFMGSETNEESEKIMAEAAAVAEKRMGESFPGYPWRKTSRSSAAGVRKSSGALEAGHPTAFLGGRVAPSTLFPKFHLAEPVLQSSSRNCMKWLATAPPSTQPAAERSGSPIKAVLSSTSRSKATMFPVLASTLAGRPLRFASSVMTQIDAS